MTKLSQDKPHLYKQLVAGLGVGALALSLTACGDTDDDNGPDNNDDSNVVDDDMEEDDMATDDATDGDGEPTDDPDFVADRASSFFLAAGEAGASGEDIREASELSEEEQMEWAEEQYQDVVWEYFNVEEGTELEDLEEEYTLTIAAATFSTDLSEATDGIVNMEMSPPSFFGEHTEIDEEAETAMTGAYLIDTVRNVDPSYEDMTDEEIVDELTEAGGALPVYLEYVDGTWFIDSTATLDSFNSGGNVAPGDDAMMDDDSGVVGEPSEEDMTDDSMDENMNENEDM